ncbi:MAG TPA: AMP-binding protein [Actinomycetes bacterium]|nr:AMP-binding protein [Actinomycetes bacterium]
MHSSDAVALTTATGLRTFAELDDRAARVAAGLVAAGLQPGDRVLAVLANGQELIELLLGCARCGMVLVPVNLRLSPDEIIAIADDAGARAIVAATDQPYEAWLAEQHPDNVQHRPAVDDVVLQIYTSGTSGRPKGVLITYGNLAAKVPGAAEAWQFGPDAVSLLATPMFHVGGLGWALVGLHSGARTIIVGSTPPIELAELLRRERVTHAFLVPTQLQGLCDVAGSEGFPDLRFVVYGAAPMSAATRTAVMETFDCALVHVYGMTETTGTITQHELAHDDAAIDVPCVGRPYPWVELTIRDPATCMALPAGSPGEIWTRSAQNTPGYAGDPVATQRLLTVDGWLRTGDIGYLDDEGRLFVTDRLKELIITGGENVVPAEVESVLREHDDIADVAVVGLPDPRWGEVVTAVVVPRPGRTPTLDDVVAFSADRLVGYKRPRALHLVGELPRGMTGKVRKHALVEELSRDN